MDTAARAAFVTKFPQFGSDEELLARLLAEGRTKSVAAETHLYWEGDSCPAIAFVIAGGIRVYRCAESGREITLYDIGPGETCILNASCILGNLAYPANAVTVGDAELLLVPALQFRRLLAGFETLSAFVYALLSRRLTEVMELVYEVAFGRMDERLLAYLVTKAEGGVLSATHQAIANDLGTSREVVSRLLKELERQQKLSLSRNRIVLLSAGC